MIQGSFFKDEQEVNSSQKSLQKISALKACQAGLKLARNSMLQNGYNFEDLAKIVSTSESTIRRFFTGQSISIQNFYLVCKALNLKLEDIIDESSSKEKRDADFLIIERSIEFPPECWQVGVSILSYFSHILRVKYPNKKIKVRIEQEDLMLRMIIDTPTGEREKVEKVIKDYGLVISGKIHPEDFLSDPFEIMALKNKLEMADLELRQTRQLLDLVRGNSQQRIESLELQVNKLHGIIEKGLQGVENVFGVMRKMSEQNKPTYNFSNAKFGGGFATEGGLQSGGSLIDLSSTSNLTDAAQQIQDLLQKLQESGVSVEDAKQQAANDLATQAEVNPTVMGKLVKWGQSLADTASQTTVSEAAKSIVKLALQMSGIPLP